MKRVPLVMVEQIDAYIRHNGYRIPRMSGRIPVGFPLNTEEHIAEWLDLNPLLLRHPDQSFAIRAESAALTGGGIEQGDLLIVDAARQPEHERLVIAALQGEYVLRRYVQQENRLFLSAANDKAQMIEITEEASFLIAGTVIHQIRSF